MNERMTELYAAACLYAREKHLEDRDVQAFVEDMAQRFSELIVRECADVCERFGESGDGYTCSVEILEHFEVEE